MSVRQRFLVKLLYVGKIKILRWLATVFSIFRPFFSDKSIYCHSCSAADATITASKKYPIGEQLVATVQIVENSFNFTFLVLLTQDESGDLSPFLLSSYN